MTAMPPCPARPTPTGFLARLLRDRAGNVMVLTAAAIFPLIGLLGGGIDIGRGYLSKSRLQQACDSGVLAARKRMGTDIAVSGVIPDEAAESGARFFNLNFREGAYGSRDSNFTMTLEDDFSLTGQATVEVPTTLMAVFGFSEMPISVECQAQLNMNNMDVMMVLDTTGSMLETNLGDTQNKMAVLRGVVKAFHAELEANKPPRSRIRYGFVPYATNVNVGYLLKSDWMADDMSIQALVSTTLGAAPTPTITPVSGTAVTSNLPRSATCPLSTVIMTDGPITNAYGGKSGRSTANGTDYVCGSADRSGVFSVTATLYTNYVFNWFIPYAPATVPQWEALTMDVSALNGSSGNALILDGNAGLTAAQKAESDPIGLISQFRGCVMERATYEITDYDNVDLTRAIDLDIDRVPDPSNPATQWRPLLSEFSLVKTPRAKNIFDLDVLLDNIPRNLVNWNLRSLPWCPAPARKLAPMTAAEVATYVDALRPDGNTYHDIGMIWGGRLLSPTGLFAAENADVSPARPTSRHMVFLTDGYTFTAPMNYSTYGIEQLERRRWGPGSAKSQNQTVDNRFSFACEEVKKKNITVWVISFGIGADAKLEACAGADRYFVASDAEGLQEAFTAIARRMGELRVTR
jgi:Flp pilus assembly protein TadG